MDSIFLRGAIGVVAGVFFLAMLMEIGATVLESPALGKRLRDTWDRALAWIKIRRAIIRHTGVFLVLLALLLPGCTKSPESLLAATPIPSPTPDAKLDPQSCVQADLKAFAEDGGQPPVEAVVGEFFGIRAVPVNASGTPLAASCGASQVYGWNWAGPGCDQFGDRTSQVGTFFCLNSGTFDGLATHGAHKAVVRVRIVR